MPYPLPSNLYPASTKCVQLQIPDDLDWQAHFWGMLDRMAVWTTWERDEAKSARIVAKRWREIFDLARERFESGAYTCEEVESDTCYTYSPFSSLITYAPTFPTDPTTPDGYDQRIWYTGNDNLLDIIPLDWIPDVRSTDVYVNPHAKNFDPLALIEDLINGTVVDLAQSGLPRLHIDVQGEAEVELHLLGVPQGGWALIVVDGDLASADIIDLSTLSIGDVGDLMTFVETFFGLVAGGGIISEIITEVDVPAGQHEVSVYFLPQVSTATLFGWGGGFRELVICSDSIQPEVAPVNELTYEIAADSLSFRFVKVADGTPVGDWIPIPVPAFVAGTSLPPGSAPQIQAVAATEWEISPVTGADGATGPAGADGAQGVPGENAPIPDFSWDGTQLQIDADADGTVDVTSPDLQGPAGPQGVQGPQGEQGATGATGPQGPQGPEGGSAGTQWVIPAATTEDQHCYAAWKVAEILTDQAEDVMEIVDANQTVVLDIVEAIAEYIGLGFGGESAEVLTDGVIGNAIDFVRQNVEDAQAIRKVAEHIYCWMQNNDESTYDSMFEPQNIAWPGGFPTPIISGDTFENLGEVINFIYGIGTGASVGYFTLSLSGFFYNRLTAGSGLNSGISKTIGRAIQLAQYFDERDCVTFDCGEWEHTFDFTISEQGFTPSSAGYAVYEAGAGWSENLVDGYMRCFVLRTFAESTLTEFEATFEHTQGTESTQLLMQIKNNSSVVEELREYDDELPSGVLTRTITLSSNADEIFFAHVPGQNDGECTLTRVVLRGTGTNPFN